MDSWGAIQRELAKCETYLEMEAYVADHTGPPLPVFEIQSVISARGTIDKIALGLIVDERENHWPLLTYGDGNCLPRALSTHVYGNQNHFDEMRGLITYEGVVNKIHYLNNDYLSYGAVRCYKRANLLQVFSHYSDVFIPGDVLTPTVIQRTYEGELLEVANSCTYCGIWQLFQALYVLGRKVTSQYPKGLNKSIRADLNRTIYPLVPSNYPPVHILWSYVNRTKGSPNHFVPMLLMSILLK